MYFFSISLTDCLLKESESTPLPRRNHKEQIFEDMKINFNLGSTSSNDPMNTPKSFVSSTSALSADRTCFGSKSSNNSTRYSESNDSLLDVKASGFKQNGSLVNSPFININRSDNATDSNLDFSDGNHQISGNYDEAEMNTKDRQSFCDMQSHLISSDFPVGNESKSSGNLNQQFPSSTFAEIIDSVRSHHTAQSPTIHSDFHFQSKEALKPSNLFPSRPPGDGEDSSDDEVILQFKTPIRETQPKLSDNTHTSLHSDDEVIFQFKTPKRETQPKLNDNTYTSLQNEFDFDTMDLSKMPFASEMSPQVESIDKDIYPENEDSISCLEKTETNASVKMTEVKRKSYGFSSLMGDLGNENMNGTSKRESIGLSQLVGGLVTLDEEDLDFMSDQNCAFSPMKGGIQLQGRSSLKSEQINEVPDSLTFTSPEKLVSSPSKFHSTQPSSEFPPKSTSASIQARLARLQAEMSMILHDSVEESDSN